MKDLDFPRLKPRVDVIAEIIARKKYPDTQREDYVAAPHDPNQCVLAQCPLCLTESQP